MGIKDAIKPLAVPAALTLYTILMLSITPILAKILVTVLWPGILAWAVMAVFVGGWLYSLYKLTIRLRNRFISG